jgi:hypothetical protein
MPNAIKYKEGNLTGSLQKGNVALGISVQGPTSTTGWYSGLTPDLNRYVVYKTDASNTPRIFYPADDSELIRLAKQEGATGVNTGSAISVLSWMATQTNLMVVNKNYPDIVTDELSLLVDASFTPSYPVNPSQVNLLYNNGVYTPGAGASGFSSLGLWVTESVIIPNNKFRISTGTVFRSAGSQTLRFNVPLAVLTNYQPYNLSFNYQIISGSLFHMTDWNDTSLSNNLNIDYGNYQYSASTGTTTQATPAGTYNSTYRFMDFAFGTGSIVDIWDIQLTQNVSASLFNTGSGTTWYDISGNNNSGFLINGTSYNTNNYMVFDGVDDYINGQDSVPLGNPCTVMALINCNSGGSGAGVVFGSSANGSDNWFEINNTSVQLFATRIADTDNFTLSGGTLVCNGTRWYNIAMTIDGATAKIYLDGVEVNSVTQQFTIGDWTGTFDIGRRGKVSQRYFKGSISNVIGYNKSLSEDELRQNYYGGPIVTDGLTLAVDAGNLVSYERGSTTTYSLTGSFTGSLQNGTGFSSNNGGAWSFDGTDDRLTFGSPNMTSSCTVNQWIQPLSGSATTMRPVEYVAVNSATAVIYSQLIKSSNVWYHQVLVSGYQAGYAQEMNIYFQSNVTQFVQNNTPYNFSFTWERTPGVNSILKTYLNGVFREQQIQTNDYWANTASLATSTYTVDSSYKGNIGTTSFYNRALTAAEVSQNFNAQRNRFGI